MKINKIEVWMNYDISVPFRIFNAIASAVTQYVMMNDTDKILKNSSLMTNGNKKIFML